MDYIKQDNNINGYMKVEISRDTSLVSTENIVDNINEYEQYIKEKDTTRKYRLMFSINPLCTNILFNIISEIVKNEGGKNVERVTELNNGSVIKTKYNNYTQRVQKNKIYGISSDAVSLKRSDLILDTGYSCKDIYTDKKPFIYHCGLDIFNNHILRSKDFFVINKLGKNSTDRDKFNTIYDYKRDYYGEHNKINQIKETTIEEISEHCYTLDNIDSFINSVNNNLKLNNGWVGFKNKSTLEIPNVILMDSKVTINDQISINKVLNNHNADEFIDMYPDRTLYSFIPKYNDLRHRLEYNWHFCLTYPYKNIYDNDLIDGGLKCEYVISSNKNIDGTVTFRSFIKHNFTPNTRISLKFGNNDVDTTIVDVGLNGEYTDYYFSVNFNDIQKAFRKDSIIRACKIVNGEKCKYYIREFRKVPNFMHHDIDLSNGITEEEIEECIKRPFNVTLNKLGFAKNAYGDNIAQLIYNDDIEVRGLTDNLGREVTEIYLTIIKNNSGFEKWYKNEDISSDEIEFSHCFGKISAGLDLPVFSEKYNIHKIHNVTKLTNKIEEQNNILRYINKSPEHLCENITINNETFLGDIVEFIPSFLEETVLEPIYFRFNTAQRELFNNEEYSTFKIDEIIYDDYDYLRNEEPHSFKCAKINYGTKIQENIDTEDKGIKNVNINPEGYFYKPHYRIKLREYEDNIELGSHKLIGTYIISNAENEIKEITIVINPEIILSIGDLVYVLDEKTRKRYENVHVQNIDGLNVTLVFEDKIIVTNTRFLIFKPNILKPKYAYELMNNSGEFIWRNIKSFGDIGNDNELFNTIFTNGALYYEPQINFYLRRQDPFGHYNMINFQDMPEEMSLLFIGAEEKNIEQYKYIKDDYTTC